MTALAIARALKVELPAILADPNEPATETEEVAG